MGAQHNAQNKHKLIHHKACCEQASCRLVYGFGAFHSVAPQKSTDDITIMQGMYQFLEYAEKIPAGL